MATESPLIHDGGNSILGFDARNSTFTGTTLQGPSGSGQYLAVYMGTTARTVGLAITSTYRAYGILQNKGSTGQVADVGIFGITKAVCSTSASLTPGIMVMCSTAGAMIAYSSGAGVFPCGITLTGAAAGEVFTMALYGFGGASIVI